MAEKFADLLGSSYKAETLRFLKDNPDDFYTINEISSNVSGSNPSVKTFLEDLSDLGLVKFRKKGGSYLVEYNNDSRYDDAVTAIFQSDIKDLLQDARMYSSTLYGNENVGQHITSIVLYGSVARGTADVNSDIDLLILVESHEEEVMEEALKLADKYSDSETEIVPMVESCDEFATNFSNSNRFELNVVEEGEILKGGGWKEVGL